MAGYYLKTAFRHIKTRKIYSTLNIAGLAIGLAGCLLILLWVQDEVSYDRYHKNARRIFRVERWVTTQDHHLWPITSAPYGPVLMSEYPEIENQARVHTVNLTIQGADRVLRDAPAILTDGSLFSIFDFAFEEGDPDTALDRPDAVVLTAEKARLLTGTRHAMGRVIRIRWNGELRDFTVTGILREIPENSHFRFNMALSILNHSETVLNRWVGNFLYTYVLLAPQADPVDLEARFAAFAEKHLAGPHQAYIPEGKTFSDLIKLQLKPLADIHLNPTPDWEIGTPGNAASVYAFSAIALLILLIACINFTNLTTAQAGKRAREVGLRKTAGARRSQLRRQFLGEATGLTLIALGIALGIIQLILPYFNRLSGKETAFSSLFQGWNPLFLIGLILFTGLAAGLYPAFVLSAFKPIVVLKGRIHHRGPKGLFRQILVVGQFIISIGLIAGTLVVTRQMNYIHAKPLGFDPHGIVVIEPSGSFSQDQFAPLRNDLLSHPGILRVTGAERVPGDLLYGDTLYRKQGDDHRHRFIHWSTNYDYIDALKIAMVSGRPFSRAFGTDTTAVLLNETAARAIMLDPEYGLGQQIERVMNDSSVRSYTVIGVMKDFHFKTLHQEIEPVALFLDPDDHQNVLIEIDPGYAGTVLPFIESRWRSHFPSREFNHRFLDQTLRGLYTREMKVRDIFTLFSLLSIFLACLGLLGLVSYAAEVRTKEIGIRKVLGASVRNITALLSKEFIQCVVIAALIAWPLAYWLMNRWLGNFAYRIGIGADVFLLSGLLAMSIAMLAVGTQAIRAATANPIQTLRYE